MSTRSNIIFEKNQFLNENNPNNGYRAIQYYRHYDGYITGAGLDLALMMVKFINEVDADECNTIWEIENWLDQNMTHIYQKECWSLPHGDIEYMYAINFDNGLTVTAYIRQGFGSDSEVEKWREWPSKELFRAEVLKMGDKNYWNLKKIHIEE